MKSRFIKIIIAAVIVCFVNGLISLCINLIEPLSNYLSESIGYTYIAIFRFSLSFAIFLFIVFYNNKNYKSSVSEKFVSDEFETWYENLYNNKIEMLEEMRKKVSWRCSICIFFLFVFILGIIIGITLQEFNFSDTLNNIGGACIIVGFVSFILLMFFAAHFSNFANEYEKSFKKEIIEDLVKLVDERLVYEPFEHVRVYSNEGEGLPFLRKEYQLEAKFDEGINEFQVDDYIEGKINQDIGMNFSDIKVTNGNIRGKNKEVLFNGIFAIVFCNKAITTYLKIVKNKLKNIQKLDIESLNLEGFKNYFNIQVEGENKEKNILTVEVMKAIVSFYQKYNWDLEIVFKNDKIYLRFFTGPMFSPITYGNAMDKKILFDNYSTLKLIVETTKKISIAFHNIEL